jgi:hypothetical protein
MAEFLYLYRGSERVTAGMSPQQMQEYLQRFAGWIGSLGERKLLSSTSCAPLDPSGKTLSGPKAVVTEGPYAEAKDLVGGFSVISAQDLDAAVVLARECPFLGVGGTVEVRQLRSRQID